MRSPSPQPEFDAVALDYDAQLNKGLQLAGEGKEYFARERVAFVRSLLGAAWRPDARVLDYGCGIGTAAPFLTSELAPRALVGCDLSTESVAEARRIHGGASTTFCDLKEVDRLGPFDLSYCNGVFHHIPPAERPGGGAPGGFADESGRMVRSLGE